MTVVVGVLRAVPVMVLAAASLAGCGSSGTAPAAAGSATVIAEPVSSSASPAGRPSAICGPAAAVARRMGMKALTVYSATTDPNHLLGRQGEYASKVEWSTDGEDSGIEAFGDTADAQLRFAYLRAFRPPIGDGYDYLYRAAILRLASVYTPAQASSLKASFERACQES